MHSLAIEPGLSSRQRHPNYCVTQWLCQRHACGNICIQVRITHARAAQCFIPSFWMCRCTVYWIVTIIGSCPSKEQSVLEHIQVMDLILQTVSWGDLLLSIFALYALCFALHCYSRQLHLLFPCKLMLRNVFKVHLCEWTMSHKTSESVHGYNWLQQCNWFHIPEWTSWKGWAHGS